MLFSLIEQIDFFSQPIYFLSMLLLLIIPMLISLSFHEAAHAFAAYSFGDDTPKKQNRLTLNPMAHFDTAGFIMMLIVGIGWAKPVMINVKNWTQFMIVAICGPLSNLLFALIFAILKAVMILKLNYDGTFASPLYFMFDMFVYINIMLALFNLIPIPPMDGSRVVSWLLPTDDLKEKYNSISPYCIAILLIGFFVFKWNFLYIMTIYVINHLYNFLGSIL